MTLGWKRHSESQSKKGFPAKRVEVWGGRVRAVKLFMGVGMRSRGWVLESEEGEKAKGRRGHCCVFNGKWAAGAEEKCTCCLKRSHTGSPARLTYQRAFDSVMRFCNGHNCQYPSTWDIPKLQHTFSTLETGAACSASQSLLLALPRFPSFHTSRHVLATNELTN